MMLLSPYFTQRSVRSDSLTLSTIFIILTFIILTDWAMGSRRSEAASFDCQKATQEAEKIICADAELNVIDTALGNRYNQIRAMLAKAEADALRKEQLAWIQERNSCAKKSDPIHCMKALYEQRLRALAEYLTPSEPIKAAPQPPPKTATPSTPPPKGSEPAAPLLLSAEGLGALNKNSAFDQGAISNALPGYTLESTPINREGQFIQTFTAHRQGKPAIRLYPDATQQRIAKMVIFTSTIRGPNNLTLGTDFDTVSGNQSHLFNCEAGLYELNGLVLCYFDNLPTLQYAFEPVNWQGPLGELPPRRALRGAKLVQWVWVAR